MFASLQQTVPCSGHATLRPPLQQAKRPVPPRIAATSHERRLKAVQQVVAPASSNEAEESRLLPANSAPSLHRWQQHQVPPPAQLPNHVAIIMDGNSRWAARRGQPSAAGHRAGVEALRRTVTACLQLGLPCLTVYAFSAENWQRDAAEVDFLFSLVESTLQKELAELRQQGVRLLFAGDLRRLPHSLQRQAAAAEAATAGNRALQLTICLGYGAQQDIAAAARSLAKQVAAGELAAEAITPELLASSLSTARLGAHQPPDLLIRPGGEQRLSNFLLFELAYAEVAFLEVEWPDFDAAHLAAALCSYSQRQRRFGRRV